MEIGNIRVTFIQVGRERDGEPGKSSPKDQVNGLRRRQCIDKTGGAAGKEPCARPDTMASNHGNNDLEVK
jgi:hypothetical protein